MKPLLEAIKNKDARAALEWKKSEHWATVEQLIQATSGEVGGGMSGALGGSIITDTPPSSSTTPSSSESSGNNSWTCSHCTFINQTISESCDMCHLPR